MTYVVNRNADTLSERLNLHDYNIFKLCSYNHLNYENIPFTVTSQSSVNTELLGILVGMLFQQVFRYKI